MIWSGRKTSEQRDLERKEKEKWHQWFAWKPVQVGENGGRYQKAWLCKVFRRRVRIDHYDGYFYRWAYSTSINEVMEEILIGPLPKVVVRPPPPPLANGGVIKPKPTPTPTAGVRRYSI